MPTVDFSDNGAGELGEVAQLAPRPGLGECARSGRRTAQIRKCWVVPAPEWDSRFARALRGLGWHGREWRKARGHDGAVRALRFALWASLLRSGPKQTASIVDAGQRLRDGEIHAYSQSARFNTSAVGRASVVAKLVGLPAVAACRTARMRSLIVRTDAVR